MPIDEGPIDPAPLLNGHWYDALAAILDTELRAGHATPSRQLALRLAVAAKRVLDLDAEDYWPISREFPQRHWAEELGAACFPLEPRSPERGALGSLVATQTVGMVGDFKVLNWYNRKKAARRAKR